MVSGFLLFVLGRGFNRARLLFRAFITGDPEAGRHLQVWGILLPEDDVLEGTVAEHCDPLGIARSVLSPEDDSIAVGGDVADEESHVSALAVVIGEALVLDDSRARLFGLADDEEGVEGFVVFAPSEEDVVVAGFDASHERLSLHVSDGRHEMAGLGRSGGGVGVDLDPYPGESCSDQLLEVFCLEAVGVGTGEVYFPGGHESLDSVVRTEEADGAGLLPTGLDGTTIRE